MVLGSAQPLVKMSTRNIPGGKGGRYVRLTTSPPLLAKRHEIWEPKTPGTLWATPGLLRDSFFYMWGWCIDSMYLIFLCFDVCLRMAIYDTCSVFMLWIIYNPMQFMSICWCIWRIIRTVHGMNNNKFQRIKHRTTLAWTVTALLAGSPDIRAGAMLFSSAQITNKMHITSYPGAEHSLTLELRIHASMPPYVFMAYS